MVNTLKFSIEIIGSLTYQLLNSLLVLHLNRPYMVNTLEFSIERFIGSLVHRFIAIETFGNKLIIYSYMHYIDND